MEYNPEAAKKDFVPENKPRLEKLREAFAKTEPFTAANLEAALKATAAELGVKAGVLVHPTRLAIIFAYQWESEGMDLPSLALPEHQDDLIAKVAAANPHTVVVVESGGPMTYTPGTKMPEQKIRSAQDRRALVEFLAKATKSK